jgi:hypothetical protein
MRAQAQPGLWWSISFQSPHPEATGAPFTIKVLRVVPRFKADLAAMRMAPELRC